MTVNIFFQTQLRSKVRNAFVHHWANFLTTLLRNLSLTIGTRLGFPIANLFNLLYNFHLVNSYLMIESSAEACTAKDRIFATRQYQYSG